MASEKRLIDVNDVQDKIDHEMDVCNSGLIRGELKFLKGCVETIPTVDAVEVVHGRWINIKNYGGFCVGFCSECAAEQKATNATALRAFHRYCRWCGAKMDGGNEDG